MRNRWHGCNRANMRAKALCDGLVGLSRWNVNQINGSRFTCAANPVRHGKIVTDGIWRRKVIWADLLWSLLLLCCPVQEYKMCMSLAWPLLPLYNYPWLHPPPCSDVWLRSDVCPSLALYLRSTLSPLCWQQVPFPTSPTPSAIHCPSHSARGGAAASTTNKNFFCSWQLLIVVLFLCWRQWR